VPTLPRAGGLALWDTAVPAPGARLSFPINARFEGPAAESRYPGARRRAELITAEDTRAIGARLGAGGGPFVAALDEMEQAARAEASRRSEAWRESLTAAARRLEAAWLALEEAAAAEQRRWQVEVERVRAWRLARWPLWLLTAVVLAAAAYLGLVLGGYLPVPPALAGFAEFWWTRL
jgi:hypothetical protein